VRLAVLNQELEPLCVRLLGEREGEGKNISQKEKSWPFGSSRIAHPKHYGGSIYGNGPVEHRFAAMPLVE